jgi:hypothetical protein
MTLMKPVRLAVCFQLSALALVVVTSLLVVSTPADAASTNPSGEAIPSQAPIGYRTVVTQDFTGTAVPSGWHPYEGQAGTDTGGWWNPSHVSVANGLLTLRTYKDPAHSGPNSAWVEGGIDQWPQGVLKYGEYLVRSRVTSAVGVTQVMLLWPNERRGIPREIDFNESNGTNESTAHLIYGRSSNPHMEQSATMAYPAVDLTQWHTWGVIVTRKTVTYTLDGRPWATMVNHEHVAMHLALQQQVWACNNTAERACPSSSTPAEVDFQIDWVAVYAPSNTRG